MAGYVIRESEPGLWTVGHNDGPKWEPYADYDDEAEAAAWCSYLNGGPHPDERDTATSRPERDAARDELDTRHMAVHLAVGHHKIALELTTDAALIGTAAAIAAFLRDGTVPGSDS
jgi:hypothetical protein